MATYYPAANGDDGYANLTASSITATGNTVVAADEAGNTYGFWIRFPSVTIPQGSTVTSVRVKVYNKLDNIGQVQGIGSFANADNQAAPTSWAEWSALSVVPPEEGNGYPCMFPTSQGANTWIEWGDIGLEYYLNAVVNRGGWASGNAVLFRWVYIDYDTTYAKSFESFDASGGHPAELVVLWTYNQTAECLAGATAGATANAYSLTGKAEAPATASATANAYSLTQGLTGAATASATADADKEATRDSSAGGQAAGSAGAFNWSAWLRLYGEIALRRYYCVLTGTADSTTDVTLPMSSFQCRKRQSEPNYLQVYIPGTDYAADIAARPNGDLRVDMAYLLDGVEVQRETIIEVDLETVRLDKGAESYTTSLDGHRTTTYGAKNSALTGVAYRSVNAGKVTLRSATVDFFLTPGDTITYSTDSYTAGLVTITVNVEGETMEVQEA